MNREIERKFLVKDINSLMEVINDSGASISEICQIYICDEVRFRAEHISNIETGHNAFYYLTVKTGQGLTRNEYEFEMSDEDGKCLMEDLQNSGKKQVDKTRYLFEHKNTVFKLDVFKGKNAGLAILEVELDSEDGEFELPHVIGKEVTGVSRYYNANLAKNPFEDWEEMCIHMDRLEIEQKVKEIVALQFNMKLDDVKLDSSFISDLNADSLDTVEMVMCVEDRFFLHITDEDAEKLSTVGMVVDYVENKIADKSGQ